MQNWFGGVASSVHMLEFAAVTVFLLGMEDRSGALAFSIQSLSQQQMCAIFGTGKLMNLRINRTTPWRRRRLDTSLIRVNVRWTHSNDM